jgi:hypothetical protein
MLSRKEFVLVWSAFAAVIAWGALAHYVISR